MEQILRRINSLLKSVNFETFLFDLGAKARNEYCFDLLVKKKDTVFIVKVFSNIDNINDDEIEGIKALSALFNSKPIIIGIKNRYQKLKDNTIYIRKELPIVTINTLENILKENLYPYVLARRGGGVLFLNGELMKKIREKKNISRKNISEEIGVTKRTICSYESESMRPSKEIAEKIVHILETKSILRNINVFDWNFSYNFEEAEKKSSEELNSFEKHIREVLEDIGIISYWYKKNQLPFEMVISSKKKEKRNNQEFYPIFSEVSELKKEIKNLRLDALLKLTHLFQKYALYIVDNDIRVPQSLTQKHISFIKIRNLEKIDDERAFLDYMKELANISN